MAAISNPASSAAVGADVVRAGLTGGRADVRGRVFQVALLAALGLALLVLVILLVDVVTGGWDVLSTRLSDFLTGRLSSTPSRAGISQGLAGSFWIAVFVVSLAFPIGIAAAIYLEEYAPRSRLTRVIDVNIRNLAGVPSVVYGILGFAVFVQALRDVTGGRTVMAAGITLAVLVLPIVIITSAEAVRAVPDSIREAGFAVGATRWEVVRGHVLPYAAPGILTGTVLALARALGEAAPLLLVGAVQGYLGSDFAIFDTHQVRERFTAMPMVIFNWAGQPREEFRALTAAAIVVLLVVVLLANSAAILLRNRYEKKRG
jgi:phosphate transport system permease protein